MAKLDARSAILAGGVPQLRHGSRTRGDRVREDPARGSPSLRVGVFIPANTRAGPAARVGGGACV